MNSFSGSFGELAKNVIETASNRIKAENAKNQVQKAQYDAAAQEIYRDRLYENFKGDYEAFASGLKNCIESNHERMGLSCPCHVEDVYRDKRDRVDGTLFPDGSYKDIDFSFEAKKANISTAAIGGFEYASTDDIEGQLREELPKYIGDYSYRKIEVFDIPGRKSKIVVYGVDRPPKQMPYGGYII